MKKTLKWFGILLVILSVFFLYLDNDPELVSFFPSCIFLDLTGFYCPGCGSQRAIHNFINLRFYEAINQNVLFVAGMLIFMIIAFKFILEHFLKKRIIPFLHKPTVIYAFFGIIILFWILRNVSTYPFNLLAPTS